MWGWGFFTHNAVDFCVFIVIYIVMVTVLLGIIPLLEPSIPASPLRVKHKSSRVSDVTDCSLGLGLSLAVVVTLRVSCLI